MSEHRLCKRCGLTDEMWEMHKIADVWTCDRCYRRWIDRQLDSRETVEANTTEAR